MDNIKFTYLKTPLNKYTFKSPKIKKWVEKNVEGKTLNLFSGMVSLDCDEIRNDIRKEMNADYHMDALKFVKWYRNVVRREGYTKFNTILLDPPYSYRKGMEMYEGKMTSKFNLIKKYIPLILSKNGIVITYGYHSVIMGEKRGFKIEHICLMSHGGAIHDTIATVERRRILL
jgi:hypothetical protein